MPDDCFVQIKTNIGIPNEGRADEFRWARQSRHGDIVAYRPILDAKVSHPGTMAGPDKYRAAGEWPAWDGEGDKPPVGSRCMKGHAEVLVIAHANVGSLYDPAVVYQPINHPMGIDWKVSNVFSPIRSEEDRITEEFERIMYKPAMTREMAARIYEAIRDGKVPGVKLTGGEG